MLVKGKKCVSTHGAIVTVPARCKDRSSPIVPLFSFHGEDTGNVLHIISNPGQNPSV